MAPILEGKSLGSNQKTVLKGELLIWRAKNQAQDQGIVQLKDSICFKSLRKWDPGPSSKVGLSFILSFHFSCIYFGCSNLYNYYNYF
jgi:hypothetical protein